MANTPVNSTKDVLSSLMTEYCFKKHYLAELIYCFTSALCFFIGTPAHIWSLCFYFCTKQNIKETQVFLLILNVIEILFCLVCGIDTSNTIISNNEKIMYGVIFFSCLLWIGRPLLQTCICIEQYMAVIHPITFLRYKGIKYRIAATVIAWLAALAYSVYSVISQTFPDYFYTSVFIIALAVISFCCVSVLCALKHPGPADTHRTQQTGRDVGNQQKRNAFNTIFSALLLFLFTYLPQAMLIIFTGTRVDQTLLQCTIVPLMTSPNIAGVIITPYLKLYKVSHKI